MKSFLCINSLIKKKCNRVIIPCLLFRALRSISENGGWETLSDKVDDDDTGEYKDLNEERAVGDEYFNTQVHMDDCEVFQCSVASLGRQAY